MSDHVTQYRSSHAFGGFKRLRGITWPRFSTRNTRLAPATLHHRGNTRLAQSVALVLLFPLFARIPACAAGPANLALHKPACSSSVENEEHSAAQANDGDPRTCWCADDEPEDGPEWWQVDLQAPCNLSGCQIRWPFRDKCYRYKIEGSANGKSWRMLSDQTVTNSRSQVHKLKFQQTSPVRYVKITVTGFDEGCWASISEVKVFGTQHSSGAP